VDGVTVKYPHVHVRLVGEDGNGFAIMARVQRALRTARVPEHEIQKYLDECMSGDYDHLLRTTMKWVTVR
jgi:hypothetical protein